MNPRNLETAMPTMTELPRWDLTPYFPSIDSDAYRSAIAEIAAATEGLAANITSAEQTPPSGPALADLIDRLNSVAEQIELVGTYTGLSTAADSRDEVAQAAESAFLPHQIAFSKLWTRFVALVGKLPIEDLLTSEPRLQAHAFPLRKAARSAEKLLSPAEEALAAELSETGTSAWSRLCDNLTSQIEVDVEGERLPMSAVRNLAYDPDAKQRETAYKAELAAWKENEVPLAAAMNCIKSAANLLAEKRGWESQLNVTLFGANMDRESLEAMLEAARDSFPSWRRYLRAKAQLLGRQNGLPFHDLFAPVGKDRAWEYDEAKSFVLDGFGSYSQKMADLAREHFDHNWIDVPPRPGKRDGAFCAHTRDGESRVLMNYKPSFGSVSTLAHELGHSYHNLCLKGRTPWQQDTPMTLAETASIFCETIIKRRAVSQTSGAEQMAILEASLQGSCQVVVDITSRYLFETGVIAGRKERELSAREMCELMADAQRATYGDGLDPERLHPYMWAAKPHYYSYSAFYNFPYMFGLLFALGLYAIYEAEPNGFHDRYDELLSSTGLDDAAALTDRFGVNIRDKAFWAGSLAVLRDDIDAFEALARADRPEN